MRDLLFVSLIVGAFALGTVSIRACTRLIERHDVQEPLDPDRPS